MQTVNFQAPTDYSAEQEKIARSRKYAELMQQQSMQPLESQTAGGWVVPINPLQGMAKLLQAYSGRKGQETADEKQKALAEVLKTERARTNLEAEIALKGTPALAANEMDYNGTQAQAPSLERALSAYMNSNDPAMQQMGQSLKLQQLAAALKPTESAFSKVNPHEYTPESLKLFMASGGKDFSVLKPREKIVADNLGGKLSYRGEYSTAPVASADKGMTPDAAANLAQRQYEWNNLSPKQKADLQNDAARIGISAQELFFNTGLSGGGAARIPQGTVGQMPIVPQGAQMPPQAPQPVPQAQGAPMPPRAPQAAPMAPQRPAALPPGVTPAGAAALAKDKALKDQDAARDFPKAQAFANQAIQNIDAMIGDIDKGGKTATHPGFQDVIGATWKPGFRFIPGTDASDFDARFEQVKGQTFLQAFESLKGGGQITEIEGKKATDALNRMQRSQSEKEFVTAAREFQKQLKLGVELAAKRAGGSGATGAWDGTDRRNTPKIRAYNPATGMIE